MSDIYQRLLALSKKKNTLTVEEAREFIKLTRNLFVKLLTDAGFDKRQITRLTTKFHDAGRRSAPWKPTSSRVPGRPQDGDDGNRINRWKLPKDHKFYADEITATLVEIKYLFEALSMVNAPIIDNKELRDSLSWLLEQPVEPGRYLDPIQLKPIDLKEVISDARIIQSGHFIPLDRGGRHEPKNTFLMLKESNALQGNLTMDELLEFMETIVNKHKGQNLKKKVMAALRISKKFISFKA